jgi:hypothetical protein
MKTGVTVFLTQRKLNRYPHLFWVVSVSAVLLMAGDPAWKDKPVAGWTAEEALQVLADSPWAMTTTANISRMQTEFERRDGGNMGQERGVGFDGVDERTRKQQAGNFFRAGINGTPNESRPFKLQIRWESALPIRAAELKAGVIGPPTQAGDGYSIAVYGVPGNSFNGDPKKSGAPLKKDASLRREGKEDVKPSSVEVFQGEDGLIVVYLFPLSAEITKKDGLIEFVAHIGRIGVAQYFDAAAMQFQGRLEL